MKNKLLLLFLSFVLLGLNSCSSDDDKSDVNFIRAKFNGVEQKFNLISIDKVDYENYSDIEVSATMSTDATKGLDINSEYGVTGEDIIWGVYYTEDGNFYEIDLANFNSNVTENSAGRYTGTFSGTLQDGDGGVMIITDGSFDIVY